MAAAAWPKSSESFADRGGTLSQKRCARWACVLAFGAGLYAAHAVPAFLTTPLRRDDFKRVRRQQSIASGISACAAGRDIPSDEDVERTVISPLYRTVPTAGQQASAREPLRVLILSEANICRSPVAEALLRHELTAVGLEGVVGCTSKAVHDYAKGESVPLSVREGCKAAGLPDVPVDHISRVWTPEWDVCDFDLLVAVDRYVAADAMKEVAVWDTIQKEVEYCGKIRGLYEFGPAMFEIEDPLYGNIGGREEQAKIKETFVSQLRPAVRGLASALAEALREPLSTSPAEPAALRSSIGAMLERMGDFEWDAPPMLRKREASVEQLLSDGLISI